MAPFMIYLLVYLAGGLTLVPLCLLIVLAYAAITCPRKELSEEAKDRKQDSSASSTHDSTVTGDTAPTSASPANLKCPDDEFRAAAGYFVVCREYTPESINAKSNERNAPVGSGLGSESPSVYQSMYRSIFDRNKAPNPSTDASRGTKPPKRVRNLFYAVLRHGHLILFDDPEELEVRQVISLSNRRVDVFAGGASVPEGELWIKRSCIRLSSTQPSEAYADSRPFYFFSENCSAKEDFYFALLRSQNQQTQNAAAPSVHFDQGHMVKLIQQLHSQEDDFHSRWANALIGRLFLALYKTNHIETFIREKITKKIDRVAKPAFIQSISIQRIDLGDAAPLLRNPRLREMNIDGDLTVEFDVMYTGNFRLDIAAVARIDLGTRFKTRYVNIVLATILKKLEGHVLARIKPPPSNRMWITFEQAPKLSMAVEPIVSSRQITYGIILRAIENRIREVIAETLVFPNWDDIPFLDTVSENVRGGIWEKPQDNDLARSESLDPPEENSSVNDSEMTPKDDNRRGSKLVNIDEKAMSMSNLMNATHRRPGPKSLWKSFTSGKSMSSQASTSGVDLSTDTAKPKSLRSGSFSSVAGPIVNTDIALVEGLQVLPKSTQPRAIPSIKSWPIRSQPASPNDSQIGSPPDSNSISEEITNHALRGHEDESNSVKSGISKEGFASSSDELFLSEVPRRRATSSTRSASTGDKGDRDYPEGFGTNVDLSADPGWH
ncbi:putative integral membrane protein conserved region-domain-containing protein [Phyllosticta citrichinensis]|uniref:Integral membrane protein conserved region-domain-containing protein n=1 Tax=Phyllosticta citrichinensis TaxID=1130410 RepID=A0ABR1XIS5_9PEZI